jgi:hypothetical protein
MVKLSAEYIGGTAGGPLYQNPEKGNFPYDERRHP